LVQQFCDLVGSSRLRGRRRAGWNGASNRPSPLSCRSSRTGLSSVSSAKGGRMAGKSVRKRAGRRRIALNCVLFDFLVIAVTPGHGGSPFDRSSARHQ
jgi:hypothetical protein